MDADAAGVTLYMTSPKYVFLGRSVLNNPDRKIILVGASNTANGLRQKFIQPLVTCAKISNLGIGGANISEIKQIIDLVHEVQGQTDRRSNTFVIGIWYGMFVGSEVRFADTDRHRGETDIDIERYRYGFARRTSDGPVAIVPPKWLDVGVTVIRPFLLLEKAARDARTVIERMAGRSRERTDAEREAAAMTDKEKQDALLYWGRSMGNRNEISSEQVALLKRIIDELLLSGEQVVLADLHIPPWHRDASPYHPSYQHALQILVPQFSDRPGFKFMSMIDMDGNLDYSDEVHAKPHLAKVWSTRLASMLDSIACRQPSENAKQPRTSED